ncbi:hypothetical protein J7T55_010359 [Diaporthe amygdali]|uniref:uncharacterized protein n=1 Tax=Phomopsis amygdali TaxID=1214568 RepID=UPI0022FE7B2E|nr:uncharacterized protein J7T55_010359 [Diaporthe amygdali]KAJ0115537.1 hypothetical protein J7T55_010359 [Diaporthe amygdali]
MGGVPSVPTDPNRTLQVIGAGYSRTGTSSMAIALEKLLDGPVCHGGSQMLGREDSYVQKWIEVYRQRDAGNRPALMKALREATRGFVGVTDVPAVDFIGELIELYPEVKVMGVRRDPDAWWKSMGNLNKVSSPWWLQYFLAPMPTWRWFPAFIEGIRGRGKLGAKVSGNVVPGPHLIALHNKTVEKKTPPGQMYWMEITDGWAPLCKMLDKPLPKEPFPRVNDAAALNELIRGMMLATAGVWLGITLVLFTVIYCVARSGVLLPSSGGSFVALSTV